MTNKTNNITYLSDANVPQKLQLQHDNPTCKVVVS